MTNGESFFLQNNKLRVWAENPLKVWTVYKLPFLTDY